MPLPSDPSTGYVACPPATGSGFATSQTSTPKLLAMILALLNGSLVGSGGVASGGIPVQMSSGSSGVTPNFQSMGASASFSIPIGAKGWTVGFLSGTGSVGGIAVSAGFSDGDPNTLLSAISITTGSASSAYVRYNT